MSTGSESAEDRLRSLRFSQAAQLVDAGLVDLPDWMPALVDEDISALPVVAYTESPTGGHYLVGWRGRQGERTRSNIWPVAHVVDGKLSLEEGIRPDQADLVINLVAQLRPLVSTRDLEGW